MMSLPRGVWIPKVYNGMRKGLVGSYWYGGMLVVIGALVVSLVIKDEVMLMRYLLPPPPPLSRRRLLLLPLHANDSDLAVSSL